MYIVKLNWAINWVTSPNISAQLQKMELISDNVKMINLNYYLL